MAFIAGEVPLPDVMNGLAVSRPVFHSEADFQFAFAQTLARLVPDLRVRLEVRRPGDQAEYVDLLCAGRRGRTFIEFKYATASWSGTDGITDEVFSLRNRAAMDLTRKYFVHDVTRLERFVATEDDGTNGFAVLLANDPSLWMPPRRRGTRDASFRLHEGARLSGVLVWGTGDHPPSNRTLRGIYEATWVPYSTLPGNHGEFRWLGWHVTSRRGASPSSASTP